MLKHRLGRVAALAAASLVMSASAALALEAEAESAVNVRTGPGTGFGIVDQLTAGEVVEITECSPNNWCFIEHSGPDGWVSASYLTATSDEEEIEEGGGENPDCSFGFTVGPGGPSLSVNCGDGPAPAEPEPVEEAEACFYVGNNFNGAQFCMGEGTRNSLNATFNNKISSVELSGGAKARLCVNTNLGGYCRNVNSDTAPLVPQINNKASSLIVYTGALPEPEPAAPTTLSTGPIDLQQTFTADLDDGSIGGPGVDIWYEAVTAVQKYITPRNGAQLGLGDGSNRGYDGCSTEDFSADQIPLGDVPPGTYVCARTDEGRISQFRVNGFVGTTMKLGYTTWAD